MQETWIQSLGWEDSLREEMATHFSMLGWNICRGQRSIEGYSPRGHKESDTTEPILDISEDVHAVRYLSYLCLNPVAVELS